jgi:hypothetical protein
MFPLAFFMICFPLSSDYRRFEVSSIFDNPEGPFDLSKSLKKLY